MLTASAMEILGPKCFNLWFEVLCELCKSSKFFENHAKICFSYKIVNKKSQNELRSGKVSYGRLEYIRLQYLSVLWGERMACFNVLWEFFCDVGSDEYRQWCIPHRILTSSNWLCMQKWCCILRLRWMKICIPFTKCSHRLVCRCLMRAYDSNGMVSPSCSRNTPCY